jgi:peptide/nickel transport system permease protein
VSESPALTSIAVEQPAEFATRPRGRLALFLLRRDPIACVLVVVFFAAAIVGPALAPYPPDLPHLDQTLRGPSSEFLLGTDQYGRDILSRLLYATRTAAEAMLIVMLVGGVIGSTLGLVAGWFGGLWDAVISRVTELIQGFPVILLALAVVAVGGPSLKNAMLAVAVGSIPDFLRVARSGAIQLRTREFAEAARSLGFSEFGIIRGEILPNMVGPLLVILTFSGAQAVLYEATLSFRGLGVQPPAPSFGGMLSEAKEYLSLDLWYALITGITVALMVLGLSLLGDALSDYHQRGNRT